MFEEILGLKVIVSPFCYRTVVRVVGLMDKRRPNNKKPLYRKKVIHIPLMIRMGDMVICAPEMVEKLREVGTPSVSV